MLRLMLTTLISFSAAATGATDAVCTHLLGDTPYAAGLTLTGWQSVYGTYGLLKIRGVREARDADGVLHYVFNDAEKPPRIFKVIRLRYEGGVMQMKLVEVDGHQGLGPELLDVRVETSRADGFKIHQWTFRMNGLDQRLAFYDPPTERRVIAERAAAQAKDDRENPEIGSRAYFHKEIVAEQLAEGLDPRTYGRYDIEIESRRAQMLRDMFR